MILTSLEVVGMRKSIVKKGHAREKGRALAKGYLSRLGMSNLMKNTITAIER